MISWVCSLASKQTMGMSEGAAGVRTDATDASQPALRRDIGWQDAFWLASGVPALVLFSIGGIAATVGTPSYLVWPLSVLVGFVQALVFMLLTAVFTLLIAQHEPGHESHH